jgi:hypothetical protein
VIDRSSVSAFGSSPLRQREVLLARVLLPLRAKSVDRKGSKAGAASAKVARSLLREESSTQPLVIHRARGMPSQDSLHRRLAPSAGRWAPARVRRGCRRMWLSARGVAAMTEANGRLRVPRPLRKERAIPGRRASSSFRQQREMAGGFGCAPSPAPRWSPSSSRRREPPAERILAGHTASPVNDERLGRSFPPGGGNGAILRRRRPRHAPLPIHAFGAEG